MLRVLVVCTGNICRSPLAEALLADRSRRLLDGALHATSAGTWASGGSPAMRETNLTGAERGLDLSAHRSSPLTSEALRSADLVLAMTAEHVEEILRVDPPADTKTFTLKELAAILATMPPPHPGSTLVERIAEADRRRSPSFAGDVADPIGLGMRAYRDIAVEIEVAVDEVVAGLLGVGQPARAEG